MAHNEKGQIAIYQNENWQFIMYLWDSPVLFIQAPILDDFGNLMVYQSAINTPISLDIPLDTLATLVKMRQ